MNLFNGTKIQRLMLKNFIGIYTSMGLKEIEIDFTVSEHRNVLILGSNGSGKTTILSTLHPFRETFDERDNIILDKVVGVKEIDILQDDILYKIVHSYDGNKNKSTIEKHEVDKPAIELNPAGTLRSFNIIVEEELGLNPSFFSLIKIGSQATNFIDLKSSQRKQFIGNFTPNIEEYLDAYKIVSNKYSISNKEIKFVVNELDQLQPLSVINKSIKVLKLSEKTIQTEISELEGQKKYIDHLMKDKSILNEIEELTEESKLLAIKITTKKEELSSIEESLNRTFTDIDKIKINIKKREATKEEKVEAYNELKIKQAELGQEIKSNEIQITKLQNDIERVNNDNGVTVNSLTNSLTEKREIFAELADKYGVDTTLDDFTTFIDDFNPFERYELLTNAANFLNFVQGDIITARNSELLFDYSNDDNNTLTLNALLTYLDNLSVTSKKDIDKLEGEIKNLTSTLNNVEKDFKAAKVVNEYLPLCGNSSDCCLFDTLSKLDTADDKEELIISINDKLFQKNSTLKLLYADLENIQDTLDFINNTIERLDDISTDVKAFIMETFNNITDTITEFNFGEILLFGDIASLEKQITVVNKELKNIKVVNKLNSIYQQITKIESQILSYSESEKTIKRLTAERTAINEATLPIRTRYLFTKTEILEMDKELERLSLVITTYYNILEILTSLDNLITNEKAVNKTLVKLTKQNQELLKANDNLSTVTDTLLLRESDLDEIQEELSAARLEAVRFKEYTERKENLEANRKILVILKDALDVKSGIPLVLVGDYLDSIRNSCNELLFIAYKGKFYIDFEISDKDFFISVFKNGVKTANDIRECSQGEISLVKTSLSLGIIAQAISSLKKQFNIVYLDEIDAELDHKNRMVFLDILEEQLNALHSSQCFIITHNDCFFNSDAGLILLNGAKVDIDNEEFMDNKTIIYQA